MKFSFYCISIVLSLIVCTSLANAEAYEYPINDNLASTVIGTPKEYAAELKDIGRRRRETRLSYDRARKVPEIYWHTRGLRYTLVSQKQAAPLLISIAGTGGSHRTEKMRVIEKAFYAQGFHVLSLPSPTHPDFIVNVSRSRLPALPQDDARDLYRLMKDIVSRLPRRIEITEYHLIGYSLGGTQAAFVAHIDERERAFGFKRVLMLNPSVSLYNSVVVFDKMFAKRFSDNEEFKTFFDRIITALARLMHEEDFTGLTSHAFYQAYQDESVSDPDLEGLVAMAFRLSLANMVFAADVMSKSGYMVPANYNIPKHASVTALYKVAMRQSFTDYFDKMVYPRYRYRFPTRDAMIKAAGLKSIDAYLRGAKHIGVIANADDLIYVPGEVDFLRSTFAERATIFPNGGHLGNMTERGYVSAMLSFFGGAHE